MKLQCREVFGQQFHITTQKYSVNIFLILMTDAKESLVTISPRPVLTLISSKRFGLAAATVRPIGFLARLSCPHLSEEEPSAHLVIQFQLPELHGLIFKGTVKKT